MSISSDEQGLDDNFASPPFSVITESLNQANVIDAQKSLVCTLTVQAN